MQGHERKACIFAINHVNESLIVHRYLFKLHIITEFWLFLLRLNCILDCPVTRTI